MAVCQQLLLPSMPRFYCPQPLVPGAIVDLPETVAHHLHVVRQQPGDELVLFNGEGGQVSARLVEVGKRRASAEVLAHEALDAELPFRVTLAQGLPEGSKMDWIVEKAVELGVTAVQPLAARRSVVKLAGERADKRLQHWQAVAVSASEQCGRNRLAEVAPLQEFGRWIAQPAGDAVRILPGRRFQCRGRGCGHRCRRPAPVDGSAGVAYRDRRAGGAGDPGGWLGRDLI
jgi:16S rRNA (uracil1498-N3)-methyltransferase